MYVTHMNIICDYCGISVVNMDFIVDINATHFCSEECKIKYKNKHKNKKELIMKVFTLHTGTWDEHHLVGVFSSREKAEAYVKKFSVTDSPKINEAELDPLNDIVESDKTAYMTTCTKKSKIKLHTRDIDEHFSKDNVHFSYRVMYYFLMADNAAEAIERTEKMRQKFLNIIWKENLNLGTQIL